MMREFSDMGVMGYGNIFMVLWWGFVVVMIVLLVRGLMRSPGGRKQPQTPLDILKARYAQGEIGQDEYETKRRDLEK